MRRRAPLRVGSCPKCRRSDVPVFGAGLLTVHDAPAGGRCPGGLGPEGEAAPALPPLTAEDAERLGLRPVVSWPTGTQGEYARLLASCGVRVVVVREPSSVPGGRREPRAWTTAAALAVDPALRGRDLEVALRRAASADPLAASVAGSYERGGLAAVEALLRGGARK